MKAEARWRRGGERQWRGGELRGRFLAELLLEDFLIFFFGVRRDAPGAGSGKLKIKKASRLHTHI